MAISYNTGTTANSASTTVASQAVTVPAGVLSGDVVLIYATTIVLSLTPATLSASSTGTTPVQTGLQISGSESVPASVTSGVFYFVAAASDAGKIVTISTSSNGYMALALVAYTGASNSGPIDVIAGAFGGSGSATVTCPVKTTGVNGDWAVYLGGGAAEGSNIVPPSGTTGRQGVVSSANFAAAVSDSGAAVGSAGTSIGGGTFTTSFASNSMLIAYTVGLAPSGAVTPPPTGIPGGFTARRIPSARRATTGWRTVGNGESGPVPPAVALTRVTSVGGLASRRKPVRAVTGTRAVGSGTATPFRYGLASVGGAVRRRPGRGALWRSGGGSLGPQPESLTGGLVRRRAGTRVTWHSVIGTAAAAPVPPRLVTGGVVAARRRAGAGAWRGSASLAGAVRGGVVGGLLRNRTAARGLWHGGRGQAAASSAALVGGAVRRRAGARVVWRGGTGSLGPQPKAAVGGIVRRRSSARGASHGQAGSQAPPPPYGTVPPHVWVTRRRGVRAVWRGVVPVGANAVAVSGPPLEVVTGQPYLGWETGPIGFSWGTGQPGADWVTGPIGFDGWGTGQPGTGWTTGPLGIG